MKRPLIAVSALLWLGALIALRHNWIIVATVMAGVSVACLYAEVSTQDRP